MLDFKLKQEIINAITEEGTPIYADKGQPSLTEGVPSFILTSNVNYRVTDLPVYIRTEEGIDRTLVPLEYQINAPYEGRPFLYGLFDCYTLVKDWFERERGIHLLSNVNREYGWWYDHPNSLYKELFVEAGAKEVLYPRNPGDVITYNIGKFKGVHGGIVDNDGMVLHHLSGELSKKMSIEYMANKIAMILRLKNV